jgi:phosphoribosylglycinamide formyltransferase-1
MRKKMSENAMFVSESIKPITGTFNSGAMARGEPGLPARFMWRKTEYAVVRILDKWKETTPCKSGSKEKYVRKHWYKIETESGAIMNIYFERKSLPKGQRKTRWWLYSVSDV